MSTGYKVTDESHVYHWEGRPPRDSRHKHRAERSQGRPHFGSRGSDSGGDEVPTGPCPVQSLLSWIRSRKPAPYLFRIEIWRVVLVYSFPFTLESRRETLLREGPAGGIVAQTRGAGPGRGRLRTALGSMSDWQPGGKTHCCCREKFPQGSTLLEQWLSYFGGRD